MSAASVARLTIYLRALNSLLAEGIERVSSEELARSAEVNPSTLRKDLSHLGSYGTRGVGYNVQYLNRQVSLALGLSLDWRVAVIGTGNLGRALAGYSGFVSRGFEIVAMFDADHLVVGTEVGYLRVSSTENLEAVLKRSRANIAVLSVPGPAAQELCDRVVAAGISSILSFAPVVLQVPPNVQLRKVDMSTELQILAYNAQWAQGQDLGSVSQGAAGPWAVL